MIACVRIAVPHTRTPRSHLSLSLCRRLMCIYQPEPTATLAWSLDSVVKRRQYVEVQQDSTWAVSLHAQSLCLGHASAEALLAHVQSKQNLRTSRA